MQSPDIPRGRAYVGPRGAANAHVPVSPEEYARRAGRVSLVPQAQRAEAIVPLHQVTYGELPPVARKFAMAAHGAGWFTEAYEQIVRPVSARSRLAAHLWHVVYVRVHVRRPGESNWTVIRSWRRRFSDDGTGKWEAVQTIKYRRWRRNAVPEPISAKDALAMVQGRDSE